MNDETPRTGLDRTFAPMLSELEDAEVRLTAEHAHAVAEVKRLEVELDRLTKVKRVMLGDSKPTRTRSAPRHPSDTPEGRAQAEANRERVMAHINTLENGKHFTAADISREMDIPAQGLGPILTGLERHGMVEVVGTTDDRTPRKRYRVKAGA